MLGVRFETRYTDGVNELIPLPEKGWVICSVHRDGRILLQVLIFNAEFLVSASHDLVLITSQRFVHTSRRSYQWSDSANNSEI